MRHAACPLGPTRQQLLQRLLAAPDGETVQGLCAALQISHNAVRQHLTALLCAGYVERGTPRPSGGRPQASYVLTRAGHALFPRADALIADSLLEGLREDIGSEATGALLARMGRRLGARNAVTGNADERAAALAARMDALGYSADAGDAAGTPVIEARNCVFRELAASHPEVCRFDLAFIEAATGHRVEHTACIAQGAPACRFRLGVPHGA
ncbi:helix-turn-helix transcriptional regulator [Dokdonella sp.]|uniref:helix-turn-helix transcriptional regulator n=1 Tax=Dokdonella sp. TaxID=2291710 RepID=UPI0031C9CB1F|nr:helix-turn-helix domain-containing protein [Dokdonella sp.]